MSVKVEFFCENADLLEDNKLIDKFFGFWEIFLEPLFRLRHKELFLKHFEFDIAVAWEKLQDTLLLVKYEWLRHVIGILVLALDLFFFDDLIKKSLQSLRLVIFCQLRIFQNCLKTDGVADGSQISQKLQFPHKIELPCDQLIVVKFRIEDFNIFLDNFFCKFHIELIIKGNWLKVDFAFDKKSLPDLFENRHEVLFAQQQVIMPKNLCMTRSIGCAWIYIGWLAWVLGQYPNHSAFNGVNSDIQYLR